MMQFAHTIDKVLSGEKTQTRRIVKAGFHEYQSGWDVIRATVDTRGLTHTKLWTTGSTYAVQRGRGVKSEARIRITAIRHEDVREIHPSDVKAEGFDNAEEFILVWMGMHDKQCREWLESLNIAWHCGLPTTRTLVEFWTAVCSRPAARYEAWVIEFVLDNAALRDDAAVTP